MMKMEEVATQIVGSLQVIHRFMATQMSEPPDGDMEEDREKWREGGRHSRGDRKWSVSESAVGMGSAGRGSSGHEVHQQYSWTAARPSTFRSTLDSSTMRHSEGEDIQASFKKGTQTVSK